MEAQSTSLSRDSSFQDYVGRFSVCRTLEFNNEPVVLITTSWSKWKGFMRKELVQRKVVDSSIRFSMAKKTQKVREKTIVVIGTFYDPSSTSLSCSINGYLINL